MCVFDSLIFDYLIIEHTSRLVDKGTSPGDFGLLLWTGYNSGLIAGPVSQSLPPGLFKLLEHGGLPYVVPLPNLNLFLLSK